MNAFLLNPLLFRLGLTVLHALWELLILGLLAWAGLVLLRRKAASLRYAFACLLLLVMVAAPGLTFVLLGSSIGATTAPVIEGGTIRLAPVLAGGFLLRISTLVPWLAILWALGAALMTARLGGGLWWLERIYRAQSRPVAAFRQARMDRLARRMGLKGAVPLLESSRADSPLVMGWFRPVVLIPAAALLSLSPEALEAVLAHELAHIQRRDYLANLLQCFAEALLFFHPAAWWLSRQIRELREHCCDDAAAVLCGDPLILAEGLSLLERLRRSSHSDPEPALAAAKGKLMSRIARLFRPQEAQVPSLRGFAMALVGVSLVGITAMAAQKQEKPSKPAAMAAPIKTDADGVADVEIAKIQVLRQPKLLAYPAEAKEQKIQGTVVLSILIDEKGVPSEVKALEGPPQLQGAAIDYAKAWRFKPLKVNGKPTKARFKLTMPFQLR